MTDAETRPLMVEGWFAEVQPGQQGARLLLKVHSIAGYREEDLPREVRLTHMSRLEVSSGRFVRCWAVLRPPPSPTLPGDYDFRRQAWFDQLGAVGYVQGRCRGGALGAPHALPDRIELWLAACRRTAAVHINELAGERAGGASSGLDYRRPKFHPHRGSNSSSGHRPCPSVDYFRPSLVDCSGTDVFSDQVVDCVH